MISNCGICPRYGKEKRSLLYIFLDAASHRCRDWFFIVFIFIRAFSLFVSINKKYITLNMLYFWRFASEI